MKRLLTLLVVSAGLAAAVGLSGASALAPGTVSLVGCAFAHGGNATVPAGTPVSLTVGWAAKNNGRVQDFLNAQTTTVKINNGAMINASGYWGPIDSASTRWTYPTGISLASGQSMTVTSDVTVSHKIPEMKDPDTGKQVFDGPGSVFGGPIQCTITGV